MHEEANTRAVEMLKFLESAGLTPDLAGTKDPDFLRYFEAERSIIVREAIKAAGVGTNATFEVLDFGFLHGLTQEFLHRDFPNCHITVGDRVDSPIFTSEDYLREIHKRKYLTLKPCNIQDSATIKGPFRVVILGEIIEHLDPTVTFDALRELRKLVSDDGLLIVTTPNAAGVHNCYLTLRDKQPPTLAPLEDPTCGYGHIHLWSPSVLRKTAEATGWTEDSVSYYHGREAEAFARLNRSWTSLKAQLVMRSIQFLTWLSPAKKGFFVACYKAARK